jgi:hypothetical protein
MKKHLLALAVLLPLLVLGLFRIPRLSSGMATITRSEVQRDSLLVEYRAYDRFHITVYHGMRTPLALPEGQTGFVTGGTKPIRRELAADINSRYDPLRGEYYALVKLTRGESLMLRFGDEVIPVQPWSVPNAREARLLPPRGMELGDGVGIDLVQFAASSDKEEYLMFSATTGTSP